MISNEEKNRHFKKILIYAKKKKLIKNSYKDIIDISIIKTLDVNYKIPKSLNKKISHQSVNLSDSSIEKTLAPLLVDFNFSNKNSIFLPSFNTDCNLVDTYLRRFVIDREYLFNSGKRAPWKLLDKYLTNKIEKNSDEDSPIIIKSSFKGEWIEVCGNFTKNPWSENILLFWCPENQFFWTDLKKYISIQEGLIELKFIVDGLWKCDPAYPIKRNAGYGCHLNNFYFILTDNFRQHNSFYRKLMFKSIDSDEKIIQNPKEKEIELISKPNWAQPFHVKRNKSLKFRDSFNSLSSDSSKFKSMNIATTKKNCILSKNYQWFNLDNLFLSGSGSFNFTELNFLIQKLIKNHKIGKVKNSLVDQRKKALAEYHKRKMHLKALIESTCQTVELNLSSNLFHEKPQSLHSTVDWPLNVLTLLHSRSRLNKLRIPLNERKCKVKLKFKSGWAMAPDKGKNDKIGADVFYISSDHSCIAIADGVGFWEDFELSSRAFSRNLIDEIAKIWENKDHPIHNLGIAPSLIARELINLAFQKIKSYGSSTCTVALISRNGQKLGVASIGDSILYVIRNKNSFQKEVVHKIKPSMHFFNSPYQLCKAPPQKLLRKVIGSKEILSIDEFTHIKSDSYRSAICKDIDIYLDDLIIIATDGLWDNLWENEIIELCNMTISPFQANLMRDKQLMIDSEQLAKALVLSSIWRMSNYNCQTPFANAYTLASDMGKYSGGKIDDITVICAWLDNKVDSEKRVVSISDVEYKINICENNKYADTSMRCINHWPFVSHSDGESMEFE